MAEAAAVATIFGIASFGIQITQTLYNFGSNVSSAREDANYVARHVDFYANVLDILTERINDEDPILSDAAFDLIDELKYQSDELFNKILQLLPSLKEGRDDISFLQKVKWNFTKSRVTLLVGELDYLRSTVHLLVTIIFTGRKIRSRNKRRAQSSKENNTDLDDDLRKQGAKAQNALLAHHEALDTLSDLEKMAERQESSSIQDVEQRSVQQPNTRTDVICTNTTAFAELHQSLAVYTDPSERQRLVIRRSVHVLQQLLREWTTVDLSGPEEASQEQQAPSEGQPSTGNAGQHESSSLNSSGTRDSGYGSTTSFRTSTTEKGDHRMDPEPKVAALSAEDSKENPTKNIHSNTPSSSLPERSMPATPQPLPEGWIAHLDPTTGHYYYIELNTQKTQWEFPIAPASNVTPHERISTPYASTPKERTVVGGSQPNIPQSTTKKFDEPVGAENGSAQLSEAKKNVPGINRSAAGSWGFWGSAATPKKPTTEEFKDEKELSPQPKQEKSAPGNYGSDEAATVKPGSFPDKATKAARTTLKISNPCQACDGRGGRADKSRTCSGCNGAGQKTMMRQEGPMIRRFQQICPDCNGGGEMFREKYRCTVCKASKKQPRQSSRDRYDDRYDDRSVRKSDYYDGDDKQPQKSGDYNNDKPSRKSGYDPRDPRGHDESAAGAVAAVAALSAFATRRSRGKSGDDRRPRSSPSGRQTYENQSSEDEGEPPERVQCASQ